MASAKDTFESHTFGANSFACGTWRGVGRAAPDPSRYFDLRCAQSMDAQLLNTNGLMVDLRGAANLNAKLRGKI